MSFQRIAFGLFLLPLALAAQAPQSDYLNGVKLWEQGRALEAAEQFVRAAMTSESCFLIFKDEASVELPQNDCSLSQEKSPISPEIAAQRVYFKLMQIKSPAAVSKKNLMREYLKRWPQGTFADRVFLLFAEQGFCSQWVGYPDCGVIEVTQYEQFLAQFPNSPLREQVELKRATAYYKMAWLWANGNCPKNDRLSDLFRGQALVIVRELKKSGGSQTRALASSLEKSLIGNFSRPVTPVPSQILRPDYY